MEKDKECPKCGGRLMYGDRRHGVTGQSISVYQCLGCGEEFTPEQVEVLLDQLECERRLSNE